MKGEQKGAGGPHSQSGKKIGTTMNQASQHTTMPSPEQQAAFQQQMQYQQQIQAQQHQQMAMQQQAAMAQKGMAAMGAAAGMYVTAAKSFL